MHAQEYKGQPAWGFQHELLSAGSRASSGTDGCVPELTQGSLSHVTIKSEACVPDYSTSRDGSPRMPPIQVQPANPCVNPCAEQIAQILLWNVFKDKQESLLCAQRWADCRTHTSMSDESLQGQAPRVCFQ